MVLRSGRRPAIPVFLFAAGAGRKGRTGKAGTNGESGSGGGEERNIVQIITEGKKEKRRGERVLIHVRKSRIVDLRGARSGQY